MHLFHIKKEKHLNLISHQLLIILMVETTLEFILILNNLEMNLISPKNVIIERLSHALFQTLICCYFHQLKNTKSRAWHFLHVSDFTLKKELL